MQQKAFAEYWKAFDRKRETFVPRITAEIRQTFRKELKAVVASLRSGFPAIDGIDERVWLDLIRRIAELTIPKFAELTYHQILGQKAITNTEFDRVAIDFVRVHGADKVKQIERTTREQIKIILEQAFNDGIGIDEIAERLDTLYLDQIIPNRSEVIARTEILHASNWGAHQGALLTQVEVMKIWISTPGNRTRPAHAAVNGQKVNLDDPFIVAGEKLNFPGDPSLGASPANTIQCRCAAGYERAPEKPKIPPTTPTPSPRKPKTPKPEEQPETISSVPVFSTAKQAETWAKENLGIAHVDYTNICTEMTNEINRTIRAFQQRFPQIKATKWLSSSQIMLSAKYESTVQRRAAALVSRGMDAGEAESLMRRVVKKQKAPGNAPAMSVGFSWGEFEGITFNEKFVKTAKNYEVFVKTVAKDVEIGHGAQGCGTPGAVISHEMGHQLNNLLSYHKKDGFILQKYREFTKEAGRDPEKIKNLVGLYAHTEHAEFFAECISEYMHSPQPRRYALEVGRLAEEAVKGL